MNFELKYSTNPTIKEYIDFYYEGVLKDVSYWAYPNYYIPVAFLKNVNISYAKDEIRITPSSQQKICCIGLNIFRKPVKIICEGEVEEFCIAFKPYGLSQFIDKLPLLSADTYCFEIELFDAFFENHSRFFSYSMEQKKNLLEHYLLSKIIIKPYTNYVKHRVKTMFFEGDTQWLSPLSQKTFYRAFMNICGVPESVLLKMIRFRLSLEKIKHSCSSKERMFELAYDLGFYDQAHFNRSFKQLSSETPTTFFTNIVSLTQEKLYFKIE